MSNSVSFIDPSTTQHWDDFIMAHKDSSVYHHSLWKTVIQDSFGYEPMYSIMNDSSGAVLGCMPFFLVRSFATGTRLVSLPFSDYSDVLLEDENDLSDFLGAAISEARKAGAGWVEIRVRSSADNIGNDSFLKSASYKNHVLMLDESLESIWNHKIHKRHRINIRKAQQSGLSVVYGASESDMKKYYDLYVMTRKHKGLLPQPYKFFKNLWNLLYSKNMLYLVLAKIGEATVAGIILLKFKDCLYCLSISSDRDYLATRPNHLLWWEGISYASREGLSYFDFGRTSNDNTGLLEFKRNWGCKEYDITHYRFDLQSCGAVNVDRNNISKGLVGSACKLLPKCLLKLGGAMFYRHLA